MNNSHHSFFLATIPISITDTKKQILQEWQKAKEIRFQNRDGKIKQAKKKKKKKKNQINTQNKKTYTEEKKNATTETKIEQANKQKNKYQEEIITIPRKTIEKF